MDLHIGQPGIQGEIARYTQRFDLLELRAEPGQLPRAQKLRAWKKQVPERFVFSVVLPRLVASLETEEVSEAALDSALKTADALQARWLVLQTPPSATPSARTRRRLAALTARLPRSDRQLAWEPRGLWEDPAAEATAGELGLVLVRDVSRSPAPAGKLLYARLRALGDGGRVRASAVERAAEELFNCEEAFVVIEGRGAARAAQLLRELADQPRDFESKGGAIAAGLNRAALIAAEGDEDREHDSDDDMEEDEAGAAPASDDFEDEDDLDDEELGSEDRDDE
jgi:uncharacterized protein YecE (DUF72 family)